MRTARYNSRRVALSPRRRASAPPNASLYRDVLQRRRRTRRTGRCAPGRRRPQKVPMPGDSGRSESIFFDWNGSSGRSYDPSGCSQRNEPNSAASKRHCHRNNPRHPRHPRDLVPSIVGPTQEPDMTRRAVHRDTGSRRLTRMPRLASDCFQPRTLPSGTSQGSDERPRAAMSRPMPFPFSKGSGERGYGCASCFLWPSAPGRAAPGSASSAASFKIVPVECPPAPPT